MEPEHIETYIPCGAMQDGPTDHILLSNIAASDMLCLWPTLTQNKKASLVRWLEFALNTARKLQTSDEIRLLRESLKAEPKSTFNVYKEGVKKDRGPTPTPSLSSFMEDLF